MNFTSMKELQKVVWPEQYNESFLDMLCAEISEKDCEINKLRNNPKAGTINIPFDHPSIYPDSNVLEKISKEVQGFYKEEGFEVKVEKMPKRIKVKNEENEKEIYDINISQLSNCYHLWISKRSKF